MRHLLVHVPVALAVVAGDSRAAQGTIGVARWGRTKTRSRARQRDTTMNLTIPVYIEEHKVPDDPSPQFRLRPLFFPGPVKGGRQLSAAMSKLAQAVRH